MDVAPARRLQFSWLPVISRWLGEEGSGEGPRWAGSPRPRIRPEARQEPTRPEKNGAEVAVVTGGHWDESPRHGSKMHSKTLKPKPNKQNRNLQKQSDAFLYLSTYQYRLCSCQSINQSGNCLSAPSWFPPRLPRVSVTLDTSVSGEVTRSGLQAPPWVPLGRRDTDATVLGPTGAKAAPEPPWAGRWAACCLVWEGNEAAGSADQPALRPGS